MVHGRKYTFPGSGVTTYYGWGNARHFFVYTCDHTPSKEGNWDEWNFAMECEVIKPSGLPDRDTDEDVAAALAGAGFSFPLETEPTRYLRLNVDKIWTVNSFCHICEITVYGNPNVE